MTHPKTVRTDGPAPLRFPAEQLERHCCSVLAEHLRSGVTGTIEAIAEGSRVASGVEAGDPADRFGMFREHVAQVIAGEGVLTLVIHEGQRLNRSIAKLRHGNDARLEVDRRPSRATLPTHNYPNYFAMRTALANSR